MKKLSLLVITEIQKIQNDKTKHTHTHTQTQASDNYQTGRN